ncbi:MAG: hypothetical protein U1E73_14110 [Planctomycetota bacterium]
MDASAAGLRGLVPLVASLPLAACFSTYCPSAKAPTVSAVSLPAAEVMLTNARSSQPQWIDNGRGSVRVDLHEWTSTAIEVVSEVLRVHGIAVKTHAERDIALAVTGVELESSSGGFATTCRLHVDVSLGSGTTLSVIAMAKSVSWTRACEEAVCNISRVLLEDVRMRQYLAGS